MHRLACKEPCAQPYLRAVACTLPRGVSAGAAHVMHAELLDRLARVVRRGLPHWLAGCDTTPAIVSVDADDTGHACVWRRSADGDGDRVERTEHRFPNWFLTTSVD